MVVAFFGGFALSGYSRHTIFMKLQAVGLATTTTNTAVWRIGVPKATGLLHANMI